MMRMALKAMGQHKESQALDERVLRLLLGGSGEGPPQPPPDKPSV